MAGPDSATSYHQTKDQAPADSHHHHGAAAHHDPTGAAARGQSSEILAHADAQRVGAGGRDTDPATKADALARHARNRKAVASLIDAGLKQSTDPGIKSRKNLWRNSAEWIDAGECSVHVLTPIHDSNARASVGANQTGYFDNRLDYTADGATYSDDVTNDAGLTIAQTGSLGQLSTNGSTLSFIDPGRQGQTVLVETLIHEVQHDADQSGSGSGAFKATAPVGSTAPDWAYNQYQSEFRAYWLENPANGGADNWPAADAPVSSELSLVAVKPGVDGVLGTADDQTSQAVTQLKNGRQEAILKHLIGEIRPNGDWHVDSDPSKSYGYVGYYMCVDAKFLDMVNTYATPLAGNPINSFRIQALSEAVTTGDYDLVGIACDLLDELDLETLKDKVATKPFWDQVARDLAGPAHARTRAYLHDSLAGAAPQPATHGGRYTVVVGDTLQKIAARALGDPARDVEIFDLNPKRIKDIDHIEPGWNLILPEP
jgi:hypothetical protein